jgi:hypothetical protein
VQYDQLSPFALRYRRSRYLRHQRHCVPVRLSGFGRSLQFGRTSAPIMPHLVHTALRSRSRRTVSSGHRSRRQPRGDGSRARPSSRSASAGRRASEYDRGSPAALDRARVDACGAGRRGDHGCASVQFRPRFRALSRLCVCRMEGCPEMAYIQRMYRCVEGVRTCGVNSIG